MKALLIATTLMFGTAAMAQDTGAQMPAANQPTQSDTAPAAGDSTSSAPDNTMAAPAASSTPQSSGTMPAANAPMASSGEATNYPPCSRTVTDKCISGGKSTAGKSTKHHTAKKKTKTT